MTPEANRLWSRVLAARAAQIKAQKAYHDAVDAFRREVERTSVDYTKLMHHIDVETGGTGI